MKRIPSAALTQRRAFSLLEVVLALAITSFCLISMLSLLVGGGYSARHAVDYSQAADIASRIKTEILLSFDSVSRATSVSVSGNQIDFFSGRSTPVEFTVDELGQEVDRALACYQVRITPFSKARVLVDGEGNHYGDCTMMMEVISLSSKKSYRRPLVRTYFSLNESERNR